jgi:Rrf2 family iron-sulfur cluster assembly transcriptional regulator
MKVTFSRRTDLALSALRALAGTDRRKRGAGLAKEIGTTTSFLPQVMSPLIQSGWVISERGPGGGYQLTDTAFEACLLDVVEATEGLFNNGQCVLRDGPCPGEDSCQIHAIWVEARRVLVEGFDLVPAVLPGSREKRP